ncbi:MULTISPECIES: hypothetical protein [unclassified Salinicola]|uniref:hypothetical protein n=1 Tax=unclassified Salinicola TaxID=2634022 RepID=UPI001A8D9347|nr:MULTISPECIES: hypothetical protein [unclassified Salinicola]MCE3027430.1 hypothetical protein [Salinicola sp. DM10]WIX34087.1 hypothetical protein QO259_05310 [Salinicola sp. JS01]
MPMNERIFDVAIRPRAGDALWEAFTPALPGLSALGESDLDAAARLADAIVPHLAARLQQGLAIPEQPRAGVYLQEYGLVLWQFLRVHMGPLRAEQSAVEVIFPDIETLFDAEVGDVDESLLDV